MESLRTIRLEATPSQQEACVLTWGQLGRQVVVHLKYHMRLISSRSPDDGTFVFVLLELVEYLGHANPIVSGIAYGEVCEVLSFRIM